MSGLEALLAQQVIGLSEAIDDEVASLLVAGTGITLTYNDGAGTLTIANTGLGGSTGSTDNRILRSDGTGGATVQNSAVTIDDSGNISGLGTVACGAITASGVVSIPNGAVGSPGWRFSSDTDTGMYRALNNTINVACGGTLTQQFQSDGSIVVFGADPWIYSNNWAIRSGGSGIINLRAGNGTTPATVNCGAINASANVTCQSGFELASRTKAAVLASSTAVNSGRFQLSDAGLIGREVYPDGTNWRYSSDDSIVT